MSTFQRPIIWVYYVWIIGASSTSLIITNIRLRMCFKATEHVWKAFRSRRLLAPSTLDVGMCWGERLWPTAFFPNSDFICMSCFTLIQSQCAAPLLTCGNGLCCWRGSLSFIYFFHLFIFSSLYLSPIPHLLTICSSTSFLYL